jgi:molybdopterin molybdotransferase
MTPGAQTLLVRLPDGRLLLGLPGHPIAALAGLITLGAPLIAGLRGSAIDPSRVGNTNVPPQALLTADAPLPDYDDDTVLAPVRLTVTTSTASEQVSATPIPANGPANLGGWANADAIAVIPPGTGAAGDVVVLLDPLGRPANR